LCHSSYWRLREAALAAGNTAEAAALATRIAAIPSTSAQDTVVKQRLLVEMEDPASMPPGMLTALLLFGVQRELEAIAAGRLPLTD
jgi:hypothetical protein